LPRRGRATAVVAAALVVAALGSSTASAATDPGGCTLRWDGGGGSTFWSNPANWSPDRLPDAPDTVCIGAGAKAEIISGFFTIGALRSEAPLTLTGGNVRITGAAGSSSVDGALSIGGSAILWVDGEMNVNRLVQSGGFL